MADTTWSAVNDNAAAGWVDVLRPLTVTSTAVFGDANFGATVFAGDFTVTIPTRAAWHIIDNAQPAGWAAVDTA